MAQRGSLAYKDEAALDDAIQAYFDRCAARKKSVLSKRGDLVEIDTPEIPTLSGLAVALGVDRRTLSNYGRRDEFSHVIARAKAQVEAALEQQLYTREASHGARFALAVTFGWVAPERKEIALSETPKKSFAEKIAERQKRFRDSFKDAQNH